MNGKRFTDCRQVLGFKFISVSSTHDEGANMAKYGFQTQQNTETFATCYLAQALVLGIPTPFDPKAAWKPLKSSCWKVCSHSFERLIFIEFYNTLSYQRIKYSNNPHYIFKN